MMHKLRNAAKPVYMIVIAAFVGTIIFAWGMDVTGSKSRPRDVIGIINGEEISQEVFYNVYQSKYRELLTTNSDPTDQEINSLRDETWNDIVGQMIVRQMVEKYDITIPQYELAEYVKQMPPSQLYNAEEFQTEGKFDVIKYQNYLQTLATNPSPEAEQMLISIEDIVRSQILINKLQAHVISTVYISDDELHEDYLLQNQKVAVDYVFIDESKVDTSGIEISDAELKAYYDEHKEDYKTKKTATLEYVEFPKEPSQADQDSVKALIDDIFNQIDDGADFAELAKLHSQDGSASSGGDLGWFTRGRMVKPFEDAAFALKNNGDVSAPILSRFGWHIIKLTGRRQTEDDQEEIQASHILLKTAVSEATLEDIRRKANEFRMAAMADGLAKAAESYELEFQTSPPIKEGATSVQGIGGDAGLVVFAFNSKKGAISEMINSRNGFVIATPGQIIQEGYKPFEETVDAIKRTLKRDIVIDKCFAKGEEIYQQLIAGNKNLKEAGPELNLAVKNTGLFSRTQFIENVGSDPDFTGAAFNLNMNNKLSKPVKARRGCYILELTDVENPSDSTFAAQADSLRQDMIQKRQNDTWNAWYREIYTNSDIKDYRNEFFGS